MVSPAYRLLLASQPHLKAELRNLPTRFIDSGTLDSIPIELEVQTLGAINATTVRSRALGWLEEKFRYLANGPAWNPEIPRGASKADKKANNVRVAKEAALYEAWRGIDKGKIAQAILAQQEPRLIAWMMLPRLEATANQTDFDGYYERQIKPGYEALRAYARGMGSLKEVNKRSSWSMIFDAMPGPQRPPLASLITNVVLLMDNGLKASLFGKNPSYDLRRIADVISGYPVAVSKK